MEKQFMKNVMQCEKTIEKEISKDVLRKIKINTFDIKNIPNNINKKQFFIDCLLQECNFVATFNAFFKEYKSFTKETKKLNELLNFPFDETQINAMHWAIGVLPSSQLYFDKAKDLNKSIGDMIIDGLSRKIGYIDYYKDKKYLFLSSISNYTKQEVIKKITQISNNIIFIDSIIEKILGNKEIYSGEGNFHFKDINETNISFGFNKFMHSTDKIEITPKENNMFNVSRTFNERPNDEYGRQLYNKTECLFDKDIHKDNLELILLMLRLKQLENL
jgi:hypothetical protein